MRTLAFHVHTSSSFDCFTSPKSVIRFCQKYGIQSVCVTDHETIEGSIQAANEGQSYGVQAIIGAEYHTEIGDIIGLFLKEEIVSRKSMEVIRTIKQQGGISVLPHPFQSHTLTDEALQAIDVIEVFNSRCTDQQNAQSRDLAEHMHKPMLAGADAHFKADIKNCVLTFSTDGEVTPSDFLSTPRSWSASATHPLHMRLSQITKAVKTTDPPLMYRSLRSFVYTTMHEGILRRSTENATVHSEWKGEKHD
ncbi:MAG TPA: PHP domain-containing protein [Bacteroidota bacterium]|nr:PHP domain-containing protein [Bacteroidota bacterium]